MSRRKRRKLYSEITKLLVLIVADIKAVLNLRNKEDNYFFVKNLFHVRLNVILINELFMYFQAMINDSYSCRTNLSTRNIIKSTSIVKQLKPMIHNNNLISQYQFVLR